MNDVIVPQAFIDAIADRVVEKLMEQLPGHPEQLPDNTTFTPQEAAEYLGVEKEFVYRRTRSGEIPSFKLGSRTLIHKKELDEWISRGGSRRKGGTK